jgi:hypothetical protein
MNRFRQHTHGMNGPLLHRTACGHESDFHDVYKWCRKNCKYTFAIYFTVAERFVLFEDDQDATWFAVRWS